MDPELASTHLQTIRTLMERSAVYRRALAPIMIYNGLLGLLGAVAGSQMNLETERKFVLFWASVSVAALAGSFFLVRRQALRDDEPFWSSPTRRVTEAFLPPLFAGFVFGVTAYFREPSVAELLARSLSVFSWLPIAWIILYGCAFHAAGFFMPRGIKVFGWLFIMGGCVIWAAGRPASLSVPAFANILMGIFFGVLHLAYGIYLFFTEPRRNET